jgi:hypothetical protein
MRAISWCRRTILMCSRTTKSRLGSIARLVSIARLALAARALSLAAAVFAVACKPPPQKPPAFDMTPPPPPLPPAHKKSEVDRRQGALAAEAEKLPPSLRARVEPRLRIIATVSVTEGSFAGVATNPADRAASLGIFQWAMARHKSVDEGASLWRFFRDLRHRAIHCPAHPRGKRATPECALFRAAWKQCRRAGLDVRHGQLWMKFRDERHHKIVRAATGGEVESAMRGEMASGALRTYQLVAAADWIDRIAAQPVNVLPVPSTVGGILRSDRALAVAVLVAVNRPAYLVPALERAVAAVATAGAAPLAQGEEALVQELRRQVLERYKPAERERRTMRLNTSDEAFSPP